MIKTEIIEYFVDKKKFLGYVAYDEKMTNKRPAVLVAHAWKGQDDFAKEKAVQLASLGYIGFATDVYGDALTVDSNEQATELMLPLFLDRKTLRQRITAGYEAICQHPLVDSRRISAIGFCFGGLTVIELLRGGSALCGVVSFHGILGDTMGSAKAVLAIPSQKIEGALLILHGHDDPLVSPADIEAIQKEFTMAKVDWQMNIYGHTSHAFTNPLANEPQNGLIYQPKAAARSWKAMENFLQETFSS